MKQLVETMENESDHAHASTIQWVWVNWTLITTQVIEGCYNDAWSAETPENFEVIQTILDAIWNDYQITKEFERRTLENINQVFFPVVETTLQEYKLAWHSYT